MWDIPHPTTEALRSRLGTLFMSCFEKLSMVVKLILESCGLIGLIEVRLSDLKTVCSCPLWTLAPLTRRPPQQPANCSLLNHHLIVMQVIPSPLSPWIALFSFTILSPRRLLLASCSLDTTACWNRIIKDSHKWNTAVYSALSKLICSALIAAVLAWPPLKTGQNFGLWLQVDLGHLVPQALDWLPAVATRIWSTSSAAREHGSLVRLMLLVWYLYTGLSKHDDALYSKVQFVCKRSAVCKICTCLLFTENVSQVSS